MSGGGHIILRNRVAQAADSDAVRDQLGILKRAKLQAILDCNTADWTHSDFHFVLKCLREAHEAFE